MTKNNAISANLSNQGNLNNSRKTSLAQFNFIVALGLGYLNELPDLNNKGKSNKVPVNINIDKTGELKINGLNENIGEENIRVYTTKKETYSEKKEE